MSDLPPGWEWTTLGEIGKWYGGGTPSKGKLEYWTDGTIPWLSPKDMSSEVISVAQDKITERALAESAAKLVPGGFVAVVARSGILDRKLPVALVPFAASLNQDMKAVVPYQGIESKWVAHFLRSIEPEILSDCKKSGTTVSSIDTVKLMDVKVPVAPLLEQHRIIDLLEDHLSRIDLANKSLDQVLAKLGVHEIAIYWSKTHSTAYSTEVKRLDEIADVRLGRQRSPKNHTGDSMRPYIRAANVGWSGLLLDDVKEMNFSDKEAAVYKLEPGDVILNEASGSPREVGKPALWRGEIAECCFQNTLIRVRPHGVNPEFLLHYLRADALRGSFAPTSRGVGINHLGVARVASWPVLMPDESEQSRIVRELDELTVFGVRTQSAVREARLRSHRLRRSLLAEAFAGQLIAQDPRDEPASALLEEIRVARPVHSRARYGAKQANSFQGSLL